MVGSWTVQDAARVLRRPTDADDKYSRGVLGIRTGSDAYPGAAVLGVEAAWRTGVGMVRYLGPQVPTSLVLQRRPETVTVDGRVQAWLIGSGTDAADRSDAETGALRGILSSSLPVVVDAGALDLTPQATAPLIVTPHGREHARLRAVLGLTEDSGDRRRRAGGIRPRDRRRTGGDGRAERRRHDRRLAGRLGDGGVGGHAVARHRRHRRRARGCDRCSRRGCGGPRSGARRPSRPAGGHRRSGCTAAQAASRRPTSALTAARSPRPMWPPRFRAPSPRCSRGSDFALTRDTGLPHGTQPGLRSSCARSARP